MAEIQTVGAGLGDDEQVAFLHTILESSTEYSIVATDLGGTILAWNAGARRLYGYHPADVLGHLSLLALHDPADVASGRAQEILASVRRTGTWSGELGRVRGDGTPFTAFVTTTLRRDAAGEPVGFTMISRDLTEQLCIARLREAEGLFRSMVEAAPNAMLMVDRARKIALVNRGTEALFGYGRDELIGRQVETLIPERFRAHHPGHVEGFLRDPRARSMGAGRDLFGRRKDGTEVPIEIGLTPIETPDGWYTLASIIDISERKRYEDELHRKHVELEEQNRRVEAANRLKSEFLANMSHELRTPLNGIIGFAEILHDGRVGPVAPEHKEYLGDILDSGRHLLGLINDILDVAKIESGTMDFYPEPVDLGRLVSEVRDTLGSLTASKDIHFQVDLDPRLTTVVLDPAKLRQVLYNYLSNALKFTRQGGRVTLRVEAEGESLLRVDVEDTGIGIRDEDLGRLFIAFQQLDASTSKRHQGTGLGLALTRRIVEAQGGRVSVRTKLGVGSTFSAILPRVSGEAPALPLDAVEARIPELLRKPVGPQALLAALDRAGVKPDDPRPVLLVDDDPSVGKLVAAALAERGYRIVHVPGAEEGLRTAASGCPCVVLLDLLMPGMDGFEFLERFRRTEVGQRTPVIVWTVKDLSAAERSALRLMARSIVWEDGATAAVLADRASGAPASAGACRPS